MTVHDGRRAPDDGPPSLFDHARQLLARHPDGPLPHGGRPYPDEPAHREGPRNPVPAAEGRRLLRETLTSFFAQPPPRPVTELHDRLLLAQPIRRRVGGLPTDDLPASPEDIRAAALWLVRNATDRRPATVGLALLCGTARSEDAPVVRTLGLLGRHFGVLAVEVLSRLSDATPHLVWLAEHSTGYERMKAVEALCDHADPTAVRWLLAHGLAAGEDGRSSDHARRIAEATDLGTVLRAERLDDAVVRNAARVLLTMATPRYEPARIADWQPAITAVAHLARHVADLPPTLDHAAYAARLAEELRSGHLAVLPWPPGRRGAATAVLTATVRRWIDTTDRPVGPPEQWRADWLRWTATARSSGPSEEDAGPVNRMRLRVVVPDPTLPHDVELRILVDGVPVVARAFDRGLPYRPEALLGPDGPLHAGPEPREVVLAEAYCTEGCCGALRVTVERDGDSVRWHRWRSPGREKALPALRFDAGAYEAEVDRAERDHRWEWPARTLARLLRERLRADPDVLGRWDWRFTWLSAPAGERDRVELSFTHPARKPVSRDDPWLQFRLVLDQSGQEPAACAERVVEVLRRTDPKAAAEIVGGSREFADQLGFRWPERARR